MKTNLLLTFILIGMVNINSFSQDLELWGLAAPGYLYKLDQNGENKEIAHWLTDPNSWNYPGADGSLIQASNKKLYGMLGKRGTNDMGVIFEYNIASQVDTFLFNFDGINGKHPGTNSLIQATNGKLYGMTPEGGEYDNGVIFEYDLTSNTFTKLFDFNDTLGKNPTGDLCQIDCTDSIIFYGLTSSGGKDNGGGGVMFKYNLTDSSYQVIKNFDCHHPYCKTFGRTPKGSVMQADNGKIYGLTFEGGAVNNGVLFEYNRETDEFLKKVDFINNDTGKRPYGSLIQATDGKLYGLTQMGGKNYSGAGGNAGMVFSYDITNDTLIKVADLGDGVGQYPQGSLFQATNGKMYGTTTHGACSSGGVFCYDPAADTLYRTACNGYPKGNLIEIEAIKTSAKTELTNSDIKIFPNPIRQFVTIQTGTNDKIKTISLIRIDGKTIDRQRNINSRQYKLNINENDGIYLLRVETGKGITTHKIIKNNNN